MCNAVEAILSAVLAWTLHPVFRSQSPGLSRLTLIAALVGALIVAIGSAFVIVGVTGWFLASLYTMFGYALIGLWLSGLNYSALRNSSWPRRLVQCGLVIGIFMTVGLLTSPGILGGVDAMDSAPWYVNVGQVGSLGWFILYPFWCIWLGRLLLSNRVTMAAAWAATSSKGDSRVAPAQLPKRKNDSSPEGPFLFATPGCTTFQTTPAPTAGAV